MPNPNFKQKYKNGLTKTIRFPSCFHETLSYVCDKLDNQLISEKDLINLIESYINQALEGLKQDNKNSTINKDKDKNKN